MPFDESLNTTHISTNLRNYEAARNSFFVFYIDPSQLTNLVKPNFNPDAGVPSEANKTLYNGDKASEALKLNVVKASVPGLTVEKLDYRRGNDVVHFAGVPTYGDGSLTIDDVVGLDTKSILYAWLYLAYNPRTRKGGRMKDYKKTGTLIEYTQDYQQIRRWTLDGCFITGIEEAGFDKEADGKRQMTVTLIYDRATMDLPDEESSI